MSTRTVSVVYTAATAQFEAAQRRMTQSTRETGRSIMQHARENERAYTQVGMAATAMGAASALALRSITTAGGEYQASMNQVRAVTGATGDTFQALSGQARELGASTKFSASEAAGAMYFLSSAGFDANEVMSALPGTLELAAAGNMDLATAADIASNVLSGYGMTAADLGRVNDVLAVTFTNTNTNVTQMGEAMKYVAPVANAAGVEFEEAAAALGLMGNAGIQASMAGTSLRGIITRLLTPTDEAAAILQRLGVNALDSSGNLNSLADIIEQLEISGASTGEMMTIFGQRAGPAMAALVSQGADALREQTQAGLESAGTAANIAAIQMEGFQGAMIELSSAAEGLKIALFDSGVGDFAEMTVDGLTSVLRVLEGAPEPVQTFAGALLAASAATGLLGGGILLLLPKVALLQGALATWGLGFSAVLGPLGLLAAALTAGTILYGRYAEVKAEAARLSLEMADALRKEADGHHDAATATIREELARRGVLSQLERYGLTVRDVERAIKGEVGARERVRDAMIVGSAQLEAMGIKLKDHLDTSQALTSVVEGMAGGYAELAEQQRIAREIQYEANREWAESVGLGTSLAHSLGLMRGEVGRVAEGFDDANRVAAMAALALEDYEAATAGVSEAQMELTERQEALARSFEPMPFYRREVAA
jgi:TP901 family phage tail tape measure protein